MGFVSETTKQFDRVCSDLESLEKPDLTGLVLNPDLDEAVELAWNGRPGLITSISRGATHLATVFNVPNPQPRAI